MASSRRSAPVKASASKPYSSDENCLHISYEAGKLEDLTVNGVAWPSPVMLTMLPNVKPISCDKKSPAMRAGIVTKLSV